MKPNEYLTKNLKYKYPFFNQSKDFFDIQIKLMTKANNYNYMPSFNVKKVFVNKENSKYADFEITIKINKADLRIYKDLLVSDDQLLKDNPKNLELFAYSPLNKIAQFNGYNVVSMSDETAIDEVAINFNKSHFDKFTIEK